MEKLRQRYLKKLNAPYPKKFIPTLQEFKQSEYQFFMNKFSKEFDQEEQEKEKKKLQQKQKNDKKGQEAQKDQTKNTQKKEETKGKGKNEDDDEDEEDDGGASDSDDDDDGVFCTFFDMDVEMDDFIQLTANQKQYGKPLAFDIYKIGRDIDKKILPQRYKANMKFLIQDEFNNNAHIFVVMLIYQANRWVVSVVRMSQESIYVKDYKSTKEKDVDEYIMPCVSRALKDFYQKEPEDFYEIVNLGDRWRENVESDSGLECLYFIYKFISGQEIEKIQHTKWEILSVLEYFTWVLLKVKYGDWKQQISSETQTQIETKEQEVQTRKIVIGDQVEILEEKIEMIDELKNNNQNLQKQYDGLQEQQRKLENVNQAQDKRIQDLEIYDNAEHKNKFELFIAKERELSMMNDQLQRKITILHHENQLQKKQMKNVKDKYRELLAELYTYKEQDFYENDVKDRAMDNKPMINMNSKLQKTSRSTSRDKSMNGSFSLPRIQSGYQSRYNQSSKSNRFNLMSLDLDENQKTFTNIYTPQIKRLFNDQSASSIFKKKLHEQTQAELQKSMKIDVVQDNQQKKVQYKNLLLSTANQQIQIDFVKLKNLPANFCNFKLNYQIQHMNYSIYENSVSNYLSKTAVENNLVELDISNQLETFRTVLNKDLQIRFELTFQKSKDDKKIIKSNVLYRFFMENNTLEQGIVEITFPIQGKVKLFFKVIESVEETTKNFNNKSDKLQQKQNQNNNNAGSSLKTLKKTKSRVGGQSLQSLNQNIDEKKKQIEKKEKIQAMYKI